MTSASSVQERVAPHPGPSALSNSAETHALGESIAALAAQLHAATYELLVRLVEFDRREGWNSGFLSCAHWLHSTPTRRPRASGAPAWRTGIDLGAAREKVRVARALPRLPRLSAEMRRGQLSYAKARALTRVATPENEQALVDLAIAGTAAHVERFVRAWRRVDRVGAARETESRHLHRQLATWVDDDGMVVIRGRLSPEVGAVVQRALEAAADRLFRDASAAPTGPTLSEEVTPAQRRADALGLLAEAALSADLDGGVAADRYQVVVHVSAETRIPRQRDGDDDPRPLDGGVLELDHDALHVSAETSRRLACDASVVGMRHASDGATLDVGRKTRTIPPAIRRALAARDTRCRFPGCTSRRCDAHHIEHWADGGATRLDNLLLLCRRHHRAVHEGGFRVTRDAGGGLNFVGPDGARLDVAPALPPLASLAAVSVAPARGLPVWDGTPFDLPWAIDVIRDAPTPTLAAGA